jgi:hypothetical protein
LGTTSEIEVVPQIASEKIPSGSDYASGGPPPAPPITDSLAASFTVSARHQHEGGALCRPLHRRRCRDQRRKPWRERPRYARLKWPRACPEGSLTPWLSLSLQVVRHSMFGGEKRCVFAAFGRARCDPDLPEDPVPFVRKILPANRSRSRPLAGQLLSRKWWLARAAFDVDLRPS